MSAHRITKQTFPRTKRVVLAVPARVLSGWALGGGPSALKALAVRRVVLPHLCAAARPFERDLGYARFRGNTVDLLPMFVHAFGVWEPHLTNYLRNRLGPGDTFVDVGANAGWFTLVGADAVGPDGRVVAVEAAPALARVLERHVTGNGFANVRIVAEAASDHEGQVVVEAGPDEHTGLTRASRDAAGAAPGDEVVACRPLGSMLTDDELARVKVVKVDVEGAEYAVVRGMGPLLDRLPGNAEVVIEVGPQRAASPAELDELLAAFTGRGFTGYVLPNTYQVDEYLHPAPATRLERLDAGAFEEELNIVFSRQAGDAIELTDRLAATGTVAA